MILEVNPRHFINSDVMLCFCFKKDSFDDFFVKN